MYVLFKTTGRTCTCADAQCIMAGTSSFPLPTRFSSCSVSDLNALIARSGDSCLFNSPTQTVSGPRCGNGIREANEVCDCGSMSECTDSCCNAATCQLAAGAECSAGACCTSTCRLVASGTQCRASTGDCDLAETCTGSSNECPADDHRANGVACNSNTGYCFNGVCPSHNAQCMASFGE